MDSVLTATLIIVAVLAAVPSWLTGSILKRHARQEGEGGGATDWIPLGLLPYAFARFQHPHKVAIVWAYLFSNLVFAGAIVTLIILVRNRS